MKKLLTVLLSFVMLFSLCAGAITLDTAESATEAVSEEVVAEVLGETELAIPTSDPYLGELVYYNDFESGAGYAIGDNVQESKKYTHMTNAITPITIQNGGSDVTLAIAKDPVDAESTNQALKVTPNKDSYTAASYPQIYLSGGKIDKPGTYTFFVDIAAEAGISKDFPIERRITTEDGNATDSNFFKVNDSNRGKWNTATFTVNLTHKDLDTTTSTHHYIYGIMLHSRHQASATNLTQAHFYFDNIRVYFKPYPEYTMNATEGKTKTIGFDQDIDVENCTYDAGNSEATVVFDAENKNCTVTSTGYAGLVTINVVYTDGTTETRLVHLYSGNKWKPGLNVITGTTDPVDFESFKQADYNYAIGNSGKIGKNPDYTGNASGYIAYITTQFNYLTNAVNLSTPIELERTVYYSYDVKSDKSQYIVINGGGGDNLYTTPTPSTAWTRKSYNINLASSKGSMKNGTWGTGIKSIGVGGVTGTYGYEDAAKSYQYLDNLEFIPYYKALYMNWDGSNEYNLQYFLKDSNGNLLTEYTPYSKNTLAAVWEGEGLKEFIGWSTEKNATEPMTSIPLEYKDIVLYPVFKDTTAIATNTVLSGATGKNGGVFFNKMLNMDATTFDMGTTEATYAYNKANNCIVITSAGYSGVVTINAVFTDGTSETVKVQLLGGEKWKPGLNLITGTTDTFGLDGFTEYQINLALTFDKGATVVENPVTDGANNSSNVICMSGENKVTYPIFSTKMTQLIENQRGVYVKFDYVGSWHIIWLISQKDKPYSTLSGHSSLVNNSAEWKTFGTYAVDSSKLDFNMTRIQFKSLDDNGANPKTAYVDNIAFIPAYKFTYVDVDGTETVVYAINDANGNIITSYTPDGANFASGVTSYKLAEDGKVFSIDTPIALENKDVVIYAAADAETPETVETQEMRFDGEGENVTASIRFKSIVTADQKNKANEFGFIVTRNTFLNTMADKAAAGEEVETELTFDFKYNGNDLFVSGAAYMKDEDGNVTVEKIVEETDDGDSVFATVLTGIKNDDASQVNETMVVRPYVKYVNGDKEFVFYGESMSNSLVGIAKSVDTSALPADVKANIEAIIALEKTAE